MCIVGVYFVFLLLQSLIVGYYSDMSNSTLTKNENLNIDALYTFFNIETNSPKRIVKRGIDKKQYPINPTTVFPTKKPCVQRATNKQFEIIDMIWKKTKNIGNEHFTFKTTRQVQHNNRNKDLSKNKISKIHPLTFTMPPTTLHASTTSKIEFYYLDDMPFAANGKSKQIHWQNVEAIESTSVPFLIFHLRGPYNGKIPHTSFNITNEQVQNQTKKVSVIKSNNSLLEEKNQNTIPRILLDDEGNTLIKKKPKSHHQFLKEYFFEYNAFFKGTSKSTIAMDENSSNNTSDAPSSHHVTSDETTAYDKIKFFEIYDKFTPAAYELKENNSKVEHNDTNLTDKNQKTLLEHLDNGQASHDHIQAKHSKKHIIEYFQKSNQPSQGSSKTKFVIKTYKKRTNVTSYFINGTTKSEPNNRTYLAYSNETARWSDYPFTAVYIYEPSQVHCDAAAINTYWLIASGSCLSRVKKPQESFEAYGGGQSAFVAYCGDRWWTPERVAYVKYTVVHPSYHHKDKLRQHLYNIGAIQVVNSLKSACSNWAPVSLMSHQVTAKPEGNHASAVGWGLDRFDTRYVSSDLPKLPLKVYKSVVYFDSCPGNNGYSKTKELDGGGGVKNVLCLALPPYYGEETDPVHGGLLLADGKLIALYLQEERRPWGEQSAQYTGIWRLIPWLMDVAREPEEIDTVIFEV